MSSQKKVRPPIPPKLKQRSLSDQSEQHPGYAVETSGVQTLPHVQSDVGRKTRSPKTGTSSVAEEEDTVFERAVGASTRQALPPEDCVTVLNLPPVEPQMIVEDETPVFYVSSSLPSKSSRKGSSVSSGVSDSGFRQSPRQSSSDNRSRSIPDHLEDPEFRHSSSATDGDSPNIIEEQSDYSMHSYSMSSQSIRIEPSPERILCPSDNRGSLSDPDLIDMSLCRGVLSSDPNEDSPTKGVKGRGMRRSMLMLSRSTNALASLHSPDEKSNKITSPDKKKVDIDKLNRFFGESKETATDLEANIYHMLISGNTLMEPSPGLGGIGKDASRAKKSASTWFLSQKALESLPDKPLDAQIVPKSKRAPAEEITPQKLREGITEKGKKIMKSFKKRVAGVTAMNEGLVPTEDAHGTFEIPLEECVMSQKHQFVPWLVEKCVGVIEEEGLLVEGIYRLSGNGAAITELQDELDKDPFDMSCDNEHWSELHVVSNLLKLFFRKLPNSLITDEFYESVIFISRVEHREKRLLKLKLLLEKLPRANFETFKYLSDHLHRVASHWSVNKMDAHNLAIMFGPTLIRSPKDQTLTMIKDMNSQTMIVETIIKHCNWLFGGWTEDRSIPEDEAAVDSSTSSASNLQLLANAENLVARQLRVLPVEKEESSPFFRFQPLRRSKRKQRNKSAKDLTEEVIEQAPAIQDSEREVELFRIKIPDLPFKTLHSPLFDDERRHKTLFDGRSKVKRSATERYDAKTLDIHLVSNKFLDTPDAPTNDHGNELAGKNEGKALTDTATKNVVAKPESESNSQQFEIKKYRAYDQETRMAKVPVVQPTLLRKYSSKPHLVACNYDSSSLTKGSATKYNTSSLTRVENHKPSPYVGTLHKQTLTPGYHPDVSQLSLEESSGSAYWENGSLNRKTNIVVRGPLGRNYCVLSGTDSSVFLRGADSREVASKSKRKVAEYLDEQRCAMTCIINVTLDIIREAGSNDIELRRARYP